MLKQQGLSGAARVPRAAAGISRGRALLFDSLIIFDSMQSMKNFILIVSHRGYWARLEYQEMLREAREAAALAKRIAAAALVWQSGWRAAKGRQAYARLLEIHRKRMELIEAQRRWVGMRNVTPCTCLSCCHDQRWTRFRCSLLHGSLVDHSDHRHDQTA